MDEPRPGRLLRWTWSAVRCYLVVLLLAMLFETFFIYPAPRYPAGDWQSEEFGSEDVYFTSADGTRLHGWYFPIAEARGSLLFCHGNGEHVAYVGDEAAQLRDALRLNVFVFDYRGYGRSEGQPDEPGVLADSEAAHAWLAQRATIAPAEVLLMGRSLGGAVAVHLAARHGAKGLILWNTFSSLTEVAAWHFPWLPVRWLLRNRYNSLQEIPRYTGPLLQTHGTADRIVPVNLGEKLFAAAGSTDKTWINVPDGDHNDPPPREFARALIAFVDRICPTRE